MSSVEPNQRVQFQTPRGETTTGHLISRLTAGDIGTGFQEFLVVDVSGSRYRVPSEDAELL